ncbi:MAG: HAMP domain-containing sensor histidine kinase, partial [Nocardioides sp.]
NTHENFQGGHSPVLLGEVRELATRAYEARVVADCEDKLHAVRSGLAGLAGALHILTTGPQDLPEGSRERLESMVVAEVERLQRLVAPADATEAGDIALEPVDIDRVLADVVLSRRSAGQEVAWSGTGLTAWARRDDLVEVVNILLVNAWRHAGGSPARIDVTDLGGSLQIAVSDRGPGVPDALRESIFERGVRRACSPGQGLGLAMARDLVADLGGSLELRSSAEGACFVVTLGTTATMHGAA